MPDWDEHVRPRLSTLCLSPTRENEIVEELSQDLEDRWRELIAGGASPDEATRSALAEFRDGNILARHMALLRQAHSPAPMTSGAPGDHLLGDLWQDLRHAARILRTRPGVTIPTVLTLALGIGSSAAIFTVINAVLLRPLPFPHSDRLLAVYTRFLPPSGLDMPYFALSGPELADIRRRVRAFDGIAAYDFLNRNLTRGSGQAERVLTMRVSEEFFDVLGVRPIRGRPFTVQEAQPGQGCVALLGEDATDAAGAVGSTIRLDEVPCRVIGVIPVGSAFNILPARFGFGGDRVKVWTALPVNAEETPINRLSHLVFAVARLREGVRAEQARAELHSLRGYWSAAYPDHYRQGHLAVSQPLRDDIVGDQRDALLLLGGAVSFVLLIVCVNLVTLRIANAEARRREFAVRHVLGADRRRVMRQLMAEAMLLALAGGFLGVVLARWLLAGLLALLPRQLPVWQPITIDDSVLLYTAALVVLVGYLLGLPPALHATGLGIQEALRTDSRATTGSRRTVAVRSVLVVGQLSLSVVLLIGALLLIRSYQRLQRVDLGIRSDHVLTFTVTIPSARRDDTGARRTLEAIEHRLAVTPGVEFAGAVSDLPVVSAGALFAFRIEGRPEPQPGATPWTARYVTVTPRLFRALAIPLKRGRLLAESDIAGRPLVAVINEAAARLYWAGEDPIGRTIGYYPQETNPWIQIVGVVGDVRSMGANDPAPPAVYLPLAQSPPPPALLGRFITFVIRTSGNPADVVASARAAVASIDAGLPLANVRPMSEVVAAASGQPRFNTLVMSFFASVAFLLAALGLYGVLAYTVEQRVREMGVRIALGAGKREIFRLIVGSGMRLALVGVLVGVPAALALTHLMRGVLSDVGSPDMVTCMAVVAMLAIVAFLASYVPAWRATRVDPLAALRAE